MARNYRWPGRSPVRRPARATPASCCRTWPVGIGRPRPGRGCRPSRPGWKRWKRVRSWPGQGPRSRARWSSTRGAGCIWHASGPRSGQLPRGCDGSRRPRSRPDSTRRSTAGFPLRRPTTGSAPRPGRHCVEGCAWCRAAPARERRTPWPRSSPSCSNSASSSPTGLRWPRRPARPRPACRKRCARGSANAQPQGAMHRPPRCWPWRNMRRKPRRSIGSCSAATVGSGCRSMRSSWMRGRWWTSASWRA